MRQLRISKQITNRESQSLDKYLQEIGRIDLLTIDHEVELARRIRQGDNIALEKLTRANLRFVVSVAKQYQNQGLSLNDLINEGNLGLMKAGQRFDETRGFKFISYAVWWIRQSIMQALAEQTRIVRLPLNRIASLSRIYKAISKLEQDYQREPSAAELAEATNVTVDELRENLGIAFKHLSIDAPLMDGEDGRLIDILEEVSSPAPDRELLTDSLRTEIGRALGTLTEREAEILRLFFGLDGHTPTQLDEIAVKFSITRERVRQLKEKAMRRLKRSSASNLKGFLR